MYCRVSNQKIPEILAQIINEPRDILKRKLKSKDHKAFVTKLFDGHAVKMDSLRYQVFKYRGTVCCRCGLEATHFGLEVHRCDMNQPVIYYHFNLYGMKNGREVMFTKDHILPKSKGGKDVIENMQTMCEYCNAEKGDKIEG